MAGIEKITNKLICEYVHQDFLAFQREWNESEDYEMRRITEGKMTVQLLADQIEMEHWIVEDTFCGRRNPSHYFLIKYAKFTDKPNSWIGQMYKKASEQAERKNDRGDINEK